MWLLNAMIIAIAMYSKIPMPRVDWNEKNMRYCNFLWTIKKLFCYN